MSADMSTGPGAVVHPDTRDGKGRIRHRRLLSWLTSAILAAVIGTAALDGVGVTAVWGVETETVRAVGSDTEGTQLVVRYGSVTRPALATPFEIVVTRPGGFDNEIELAVNVDYLELWDLNGVIPSPSSEQSEDGRVVWTFDPPDGDTLRVVYEARIEPGSQLERRRGVVSLLDGGEAVLTARFTTRVMP